MNMINSNAIVVQHLSYYYPDKTMALKDISFTVKTGECVGLIGPNGAGKSTLFMLLMGFFEPTKGAIQILNQALTKKSRKQLRKKVGMVFQNPNDQLFSPTLWEDVAFGPFNLGYDQAEISRRVGETLESLGLLQLQNKPPHYLSFGEKKKAALATILSMDPEIILLDEPFSNLDPESCADILQIIQNYRKKHLTMVIAIHDVDLLPELVDKCILLDKGEVVAERDTQEILTDHDLLMQHRMRMPLIGQLFYNLKQKNVIKETNLPLTLKEAESFVATLLKQSKDLNKNI
jgi:cobalt/nickel transport system ATP-binding protein